jgi:hypothetical protein
VVWEPQAAGLADLTPALSLILPLLLVAFTGFVAWLGLRRKGSGKIGTSEAGTLWSASESMRTTLTTQLEKAEVQRDRLIEAQAGQVLPMMSAVNESMRTLAASIETVIGQDEDDRERSQEMLRLLVEIRDGQGPESAAERQGQGRGDRRSDRRGGTAHRPAAADGDEDRRDGADPQGSDQGR